MSKDGGPAFAMNEVRDRYNEVTQESAPGLTKLDYFAAAALQALTVSYEVWADDTDLPEHMGHSTASAKYAFDLAAAMLAESERRSK